MKLCGIFILVGKTRRLQLSDRMRKIWLLKLLEDLIIMVLQYPTEGGIMEILAEIIITLASMKMDTFIVGYK